jgi:hypothetical protein
MTLAILIQDDKKYYLAQDRYFTFGGNLCADQIKFIDTDRFVANYSGFAGYTAFIEFLSLNAPDHILSQLDLLELHSDFTEQYPNMFFDLGDEDVHCEFMLIDKKYPSKTYAITLRKNTLAIVEITDPFYAHGSGADYARSVYYTLRDYSDTTDPIQMSDAIFKVTSRLTFVSPEYNFEIVSK